MICIKNTNTIGTFNTQQTSPFATYSDEKMETVLPEVASYIYLTDLDKIILLTLNKFYLLSSGLLLEALKNEGLENTEHSDIQHRLKHLCNARFVQKASFITTNGKAAAKVYSLDYRGKGFLKSIGKAVKLSEYVAGLSASQTKKILAVNQYLIRCCYKWQATEILQKIMIPGRTEFDRAELIVRPQGRINTSQGTMLVEGIRKNNGWENELVEKLTRMEKTVLSSRVDTDITHPYLTLICEDAEHMANVMHLVQRIRLKLPVYYTFDLKVYSSPDECLYKYEPQIALLSRFKSLVACL